MRQLNRAELVGAAHMASMHPKPPLLSRNALRPILETALDAVVIMNADGTVADWNDRAMEIFGWSREEAIGRFLANLIIPERYRESHWRGLKTFLDTGEATILGRRIELSGLRKSGEEFLVELSVTPVHDEGRVVFVGFLRDITARKLSQEALKQTEQQFRLLVQGVKDHAIYLLDPHGHVTTWNKGAERIKGYSGGEILGRHFSIFFTDEDRAVGRPSRALEGARQSGRFEEEGWRVRKDGNRFWANAVLDAIYDDSGQLIGFAKITRDITERHEAQQILTQARERIFQSQKLEAIGQLTGGVAHDFNNLLTIIIGNLEIAQRNLGSLTGAVETQLRRLIANALTGAKRSATLTQRLLAFSRRQPLDPKALELNKFIAGAADFLQRTLGETIEVQAVGGGGVWPVEADSAQLEASLLNLALNSRDAMPNGGKLTVETSNTYLDRDYCRANPEVLPGQYALIAVTDTGTGMSKEVLDRAIEPFFTTKTIGEGTGLGLSQVYGFVKQSGGHLKIYSEAGQGTTVKIYLPRFIGDIRSDEVLTSDVVAGDGRETILIVEDDQDVRAYLEEALRNLGYQALEERDAASALSLLEQRDIHVDLLLTDVVLPGVNGRELAERLQTLLPNIKVLFMTGYSRNAIVHQGRLDPGVEMIQKPFTQEELAGRIRDVLDAAPRK